MAVGCSWVLPWGHVVGVLAAYVSLASRRGSFGLCGHRHSSNSPRCWLLTSPQALTSVVIPLYTCIVLMIPKNDREHGAEDVVALPPTIIPSGMPTPRYRGLCGGHGEDANPRSTGDAGATR